jgi:autotransporter-associated beta strand protein
MKKLKRAFVPSSSAGMNSSVSRMAAFIIAACSGIVSARAANVNWIAPSADSYTNPSAWSTGALPGTADVAAIGNTNLLNGSVLYTNTPPDPASTNGLTSLLLGNAANSSGTFTMNAGTLSITNTTATGLILGNANLSTANFTMNGGVLNAVRNNGSTFYQDFFTLGNTANSDGTFTLNSGTANFLCGIEIGIQGKGTINVNGGTLIDNGWFGVGRGNSTTSPGWGNFNLSGGTVYILRNPGNDTQLHGVSFCQQGTNGTVNISGGALYCNAIRFASGPGAGRTDWETFNFSGGDIYLGAVGVANQNVAGTHNIAINLSGGTFHSVNLGPNTGGTQGLSSVGPDGTNWTWAATLPATLNTSPGPGVVTFASSAGKAITLNNSFSGSGGLAFTGPGTVIVNGANAYTGDTTLSGGTLAGTGSFQGRVLANSGSVIAPGSSTAPGTLTFGSLTLNGATNIIKLSADSFPPGSGVNDLLVVNGDLVLQTLSRIKVVPLAPLSSAAPYTIVQYYGTPLTSAAVSKLQIISDSGRYSFSIVDPATTPGTIQISVTGTSANLAWHGGNALNPTAWDHTTTNWINSSTSGLDVFFNSDSVAFDDTAATNLVNIVGTETASAVAMSNNAVNFTFTGGSLFAGPLDMEGTGSLTLAMTNAPAFSSIMLNSGTLVYNLQGTDATNAAPISNNGTGQATLVKAGTNSLILTADNSSYAGTILVTNGILGYTNTLSLGYVGAPLYVTNNGTLDLSGVAPDAKNFIISGSGFGGKGAMINSPNNSLQDATAVRNIALAGDAAIGATFRWDISHGTFTGNGFALTEVGPGANIFADAGDTGLGDIHVVAGRLGFQGNVTMGDPAKTVTVESNATLTFFSVTGGNLTNGGPTKTLVMKVRGALDSGGASNNFNGEVFLSGTNLIGTRSTLAIWDGIHDTNGAGGFILGNDSVGNSGGDLWLYGANTYTGPTIVSNRTLFVGPSSSLGNSSLIQVNSGAALDVTSLPTFQLGAGQTLMGNGTVKGNNIVLGSGAQLTAGFVASNTFTLTINGNLTLQHGSTDVVKVRKTTSLTNDVVTGLTSVTLGGTLVVTNVGPNALAAGDAIPLFSATAYNVGSFTTNNIIPATPGIGLGWDLSTLGTDGTLRVISTATVNPNPTNIAFSLSGGQLTLQWPQDHTGWTLQSQTNGLNVGISNNWSAVSGSTTTNKMVVPINPANPTVFYRLILNP